MENCVSCIQEQISQLEIQSYEMAPSSDREIVAKQKTVWRNNTSEIWDGFKGKSGKTDKHRANRWVKTEIFHVYWSGSVKTVFLLPDSTPTFPLTHPVYRVCNWGLLVCSSAAIKKGIFAVLTAQTPIHTHWDHLTHPCFPCSDFPKQAERTKGEPHVWQRYSDMNGEWSKWNQQFPKTSLVSGKECAGCSLQMCARFYHSSKCRWANGNSTLQFHQGFSDLKIMAFCQCLNLPGFLGLQSIFALLRLALFFLIQRQNKPGLQTMQGFNAAESPRTHFLPFLSSSLSDLLFTYRPDGKHVGKARIRVHIHNKYFLWLFPWPAATD